MTDVAGLERAGGGEATVSSPAVDEARLARFTGLYRAVLCYGRHPRREEAAESLTARVALGLAARGVVALAITPTVVAVCGALGVRPTYAALGAWLAGVDPELVAQTEAAGGDDDATG